MKFKLATITALFILNFAFAQTTDEKDQGKACSLSTSVGADLVNLYVWRGLLFSDVPALQPALSVSNSWFEAGFWGSVSLAKTDNTTTESDLYCKFKYERPFGSFSLTATSYYFPTISDSSNGVDNKYFNYKDKGNGAHIVDLCLCYTGASLPLTVQFASNVYNDPDHAKYVELGYAFKVKETDMSAVIGGTFSKSAWYQTKDDKFQIINVGISATKVIKFSETFSVPLNVTYIVNPALEKNYLVLKASF
jgi:hypothetical protein